MKYVDTIDADTLGDVKVFSVDVSGIGAEKLIIIMNNTETGKSAVYAEIAVDYTNRTADIVNGLNINELRALNTAK